eukprot:7220561-Alexandrium_andersonii.AAC.1
MGPDGRSGIVVALPACIVGSRLRAWAREVFLCQGWGALLWPAHPHLPRPSHWGPLRSGVEHLLRRQGAVVALGVRTHTHTFGNRDGNASATARVLRVARTPPLCALCVVWPAWRLRRCRLGASVGHCASAAPPLGGLHGSWWPWSAWRSGLRGPRSCRLVSAARSCRGEAVGPPAAHGALAFGVVRSVVRCLRTSRPWWPWSGWCSG